MWKKHINLALLIEYMDAALPWTLKHAPRTLHDIESQNEALRSLKEFVINFKKQKQKAALLHGPCGTGKTCAVYALAQNINYEIIEVNASDFRNKDAIYSLVGNASKQQSLFSKSKLILIDEIDGLSGQKDRGGIQAVTELARTTSFPLLLTATNPYEQKLNDIRKACQLIEFRPLDYTTIHHILKRICESEHITAEEVALKTVARRSAGDARAAINDLQYLAASTKHITTEDLDHLPSRLKIESVLQALVKILKVKDPQLALHALDSVEEDLDQVILWIDENLPYEYKDPEDLALAYDRLSKADVFRGRISRWQHWRFLVYVNDLITAGVALSKKQSQRQFVSYKPTTRVLKLWIARRKYEKKRSIAEKIAHKTHTSATRIVKEVLPYMHLMAKKNKSLAHHFEHEFELDKEEIAWLAEDH